MREIRRVATIALDHAQSPDATVKTARLFWMAACSEAYEALARHIPPDAYGGVLEPYGHVSGAFEWRAYYHHPNGHETVYVVIREFTSEVTT